VTDEHGRKIIEGDFTPFGEKINLKEGINPYEDGGGFTGKDWDEEVGLYYFNARWYNPEIGRFISEDSLFDTSDPRTLNLYSYGFGNPMTYIDPSGHWNIPVVSGWQLFSASLNMLSVIDPNLKEVVSAFNTFISSINTGIHAVQSLRAKITGNYMETFSRNFTAKDYRNPWCEL
jgi:RHS repeat-associated protein